MAPGQPLTYTFTLKIPDIDTVGQFSYCSGLELSFDVYEYSEGGNNDFVHRLPGRVHFPNLVLSRGLTKEDVLLKWFWDTHNQVKTKEITLTLSGGGDQRVWTFADAFPVRWTGPTLQSHSADVGSETLEVAHSGLKMV